MVSCKVKGEVPGKGQVVLYMYVRTCVCEYSKLIIKACNDSQLDICVLRKHIQ